MRCAKPQNGYGDGQNPCVRYFHVAWFFGEKRVTQTAIRVEQVSEWITMWRGLKVNTSLGEKGSHFGKRPQTLEPPQAKSLPPAWKPSTRGFWQAPDASVTLDGALFDKAQIIDSFSRDMEMQTWKRAAGHSFSSGMEKGIHTDFAKKSQVSADQRGKFHGCACVGLSCLWSHQRTFGWIIPNQFFCVRCDQRTLATRKHELWKCPGNRLINHAHMKESDPICDIGAGILGHRSSFVWPLSFAA